MALARGRCEAALVVVRGPDERPQAQGTWRSASGPLRSFVGVCFRVASARRGRRCPARAHAVAVAAARRLHCDARPGVAAQNSLRSLRSLRSDNRAESVYEARCARRPRSCASRRHTNRPHRAPPAALQRWCVLRRTPRAFPAKDVGWLTQRSKGGGPGAARPGGHERSRPPDGLGSLEHCRRTAAMGRERKFAGLDLGRAASKREMGPR